MEPNKVEQQCVKYKRDVVIGKSEEVGASKEGTPKIRYHDNR